VAITNKGSEPKPPLRSGFGSLLWALAAKKLESHIWIEYESK